MTEGKLEKLTNLTKLNVLLNNQLIKGKIIEAIKKYLEINENGNMTQENLQDAAKVVLREKIRKMSNQQPTFTT